MVCRLAAVLVASLPVVALAQVYKCAGTGKVPMYQDAPCVPGTELRNFASDPATVSVLPVIPPASSTTRLAPSPPAPKPRASAERREKSRMGDPVERRYLHPGMHEGEVIARVGPPDLKSGGGSRKLSRWTYMPHAGDPQTLTTVVFEYGKVVEVERKVVR